MKKFTLISLVIIPFIFSACKKETCDCQKSLGSFVIGLRTSHFPINSMELPIYKVAKDTIDMWLYLSHRQHINFPPISIGQDYYRYETDNTEFRNLDYGLFYYTTAGGSPLTERPFTLTIDWFGVLDINSAYQKYSMEFNLPIDSNAFTQNHFIYDSLFVNDRWYNNILTGPVLKNDGPGQEYTGAIPLQYYYSSEYGIIKFDMSDGIPWEIITK